MLYLNKTNKLILLAGAIICLLLFLHYAGPLRPVENAVVYVTKPILGAVYGASNKIADWLFGFQSRNALLVENKQLGEKLLEYEKDRSLYLAEKEENDFLRKQLNFSRANNYRLITAQVVGQGADSSQNTLIVSAGAKNGVIAGAPVLSANGVLIGKVSATNDHDAIILLANDDLFKTAAKIQNVGSTMGIVKGEYGLGLKMVMIPQSEKINAGDLVITSGLETGVPAGLLIGEVESVRQAPEELFQEAVIRPATRLNNITLVGILKLD